jgi:hypothetical protein
MHLDSISHDIASFFDLSTADPESVFEATAGVPLSIPHQLKLALIKLLHFNDPIDDFINQTTEGLQYGSENKTSIRMLSIPPGEGPHSS